MRKAIFALALIFFTFNLALAEESSAKRIISLGPALTEQIYLLGQEDKLVGVTVYCTRPEAARKKEKVGTVIEVNLEKVIALRPDVVLTTSLTGPKTKEKLRRLGIKTADFPYARSFQELCAEFLKLAELLGRQKQAEEILQPLKEKIQSIKEGLRGSPKPKVFIQIGAKPLHTVTKDSFIHDFIELSSGINIAKEAKSGLFSRERVIKENPDVIIIATMGIAGEKEKKIWMRFKSLNAARHNRIYIIDSDKLCSPTPTIFLETLKEVVKILHPQI